MLEGARGVPAMIQHRQPGPPAKAHGPHTLRVWQGTVVGLHGDDVFVELGVRMQGVISRRRFGAEPRVGASYDITLGGQEEDLWVLERAPAAGLSPWQELERESLVQAKVVRERPGGLELMVGPLHAFLPRSHTGLDRGEDLRQLVGKTLACEVLEVDPERQRVVL